MSEARVIRNGRSVSVEWDQWFAQAQATTEYEIEGQDYPRIPYGRETRFSGLRLTDPDQICHDCAVRVGELHLPGCDAEECPRCHGQSISCGCDDEEEEEEEEEAARVSSVHGKFAHLGISTDEFIREKQDVIRLEQRDLG